MAIEITIREARATDAAVLGKLSAEFAVNQGRSFDECRREQHTRDVLAVCDADDGHIIFVAENDSSVVAYTSVHWVPFLLLQGTEAYISELVVQSQFRGCGIGSRLLDHVEKEARNRGCIRMMVNNVRATESYERGFYTKQGFIERVGVSNFVKELST